MSSNRTRPHLMAIAGGTALVIMAVVTAGCGTSANQAPSTTPTTTTTATTTSSPPSTAAPAPTEKSINPTGGNLFTPGVKAPPASAVPPGQHPGINGIP
jgi:hypothetical protein